MTRTDELLRAACALLLTSGVAAARGSITVFHGGPGQPGAVRAYDEVTGALRAAPGELGGVELLPIEAAGRTVLEEFLPGRARRIADVAGASRLLLPQLAGSLYHYARGAAGARVYGYFQVTRDGLPRVLVERPAVGAGEQDPFVDRVAIAPDGRAFLCATKVAAGGDVLEVRHASDAVEVIDRTAGVAPLRIAPRGLALTATHAFAVCGRGVIRASRADANAAALVGFASGPAPSYFQGDLVLSARGTAIAFQAGDGPTALHAWTAPANGSARRASTTPGAHSGAGFAPQAVDGPYLAVGDDAAWCAWRDETISPSFEPVHDCVVARVAAPVGEAPEVLTSDARFLDTLDEVAVFFFRGPDEVVFAVGERGTPQEPGIEGLDLFRTRLAAGSPPSIENVSGTSGDFSEPFLSVPQLKPSRWVLSPDRGALLLHDDSGSAGDLVVVDVATGSTTTVLSQVRSFDWIEPCGTRFAFGIEVDGDPRRNEVHSIRTDLSGATTRSFVADEDEPTRGVCARADGLVAWLRTTTAGPVLQRVRVPGGAVETWGIPGGFAPGQGFTAGGAHAFAQGGALRAWPEGARALAWPFSGPFQVLPGS